MICRKCLIGMMPKGNEIKYTRDSKTDESLKIRTGLIYECPLCATQIIKTEDDRYFVTKHRTEIDLREVLFIKNLNRVRKVFKK